MDVEKDGKLTRTLNFKRQFYCSFDVYRHFRQILFKKNTTTTNISTIYL